MVLSISTFKLELFPHIDNFIKSKAENYPKLTIQYIRGANPFLQLLDNKGELIEVIRVDKWKTEELEEFLDSTFKN